MIFSMIRNQCEKFKIEIDMKAIVSVCRYYRFGNTFLQCFHFQCTKISIYNEMSQQRAILNMEISISDSGTLCSNSPADWIIQKRADLQTRAARQCQTEEDRSGRRILKVEERTVETSKKKMRKFSNPH